MKRKMAIIFLIFFVFLIAIAGLIFILKTKENKVCFKNDCYIVEIARTQKEKERGLMYRENLDKRQGMLFLNDKEGIYPFWMKNMKFPLDIIWLSSDFKIAFIARNVQPCGGEECLNIISDNPARYILEINAGEADRIDLQLGDKANYDSGNRSVSKN